MIITGKIVDDFLDPLEGVNIVVVGTTTGTITDDEGNYYLEVPSSSKIQFSYVGFETQSHNSNNIPATIEMLTDYEELEEVVIVSPPQKSKTSPYFWASIGLVTASFIGILVAISKSKNTGLNAPAPTEVEF